jgi:hypothetical protein
MKTILTLIILIVLVANVSAAEQKDKDWANAVYPKLQTFLVDINTFNNTAVAGDIDGLAAAADVCEHDVVDIQDIDGTHEVSMQTQPKKDMLDSSMHLYSSAFVDIGIVFKTGNYDLFAQGYDDLALGNKRFNDFLAIPWTP